MTSTDYAEGGGATNGMGTPGMEGIGGKAPTLGTAAAGIGGSVIFGMMAGTAGIGGSAAVFGTAGTVTAGILGNAGIGGTAPTAGTAGILGSAGIGGTTPTAGTVGTAGIGGRVAAGTTGGFGMAGMPGTAAGAAAGAVVVSARCRAAWHVVLPSSMMSAIITSATVAKRDEAAEAMATIASRTAQQL